MPRKRYEVSFEIAGNTALWTRPDTGDSPCSYPAPTYSAAKALFESILWGPATLILPKKVELCSPIRFHNYVTNYGGPLRKNDSIRKGNNYQLYATVLTDVCYRFYAEVIPNSNKKYLPENAVKWDQKTTNPGHAYQAIFNRRLKRGQSYASLSLGWNEFTPSYFGPFREETRVCSEIPDILIPSMLREVFPEGYKSEYKAIYDTDVWIKNGVLVYPERRLMEE
ncbi:MAG TPA: CRISPR-associated protein Cas5 [Mogibacterium sp.]|nr:CRISPR-associated protein Cas5 [Mogibacterium sp.]